MTFCRCQRQLTEGSYFRGAFTSYQHIFCVSPTGECCGNHKKTGDQWSPLRPRSVLKPIRRGGHCPPVYHGFCRIPLAPLRKGSCQRQLTEGSHGFHRSPEPGCRNHRIRNSVRAPTKKPVGETPTGGALFDYVSGVTSGVGSATIVNTKVFGKAKKSPPRTLAVTMYLPGAVGMVLFA